MANEQKNQSETSKAALSDAERAEIMNDIRTVNDHIRHIREHIQRDLTEISRSEKHIEYLLKELAGEVPETIPLADCETLPIKIEGVRVSAASLERAIKRHGVDQKKIDRTRIYLSVTENLTGDAPCLSIRFNYHRTAGMIFQSLRGRSWTKSAFDTLQYSSLEEVLKGVRCLSQVVELASQDEKVLEYGRMAQKLSPPLPEAEHLPNQETSE